ncbi:amidohydrolase family protein [Frigoribacterium sp. PhB24]|uniref:N-acyl-D-amino-acid deacylase family protein n=1 Tax=Frigoribacterium sp. PhB24 TaxID=2485204 RepID=UPI000F4699DE|nr:amidohydrolase family protein [Frigoribacterium sp. PhB24]ROS50525.1 dihydroorotase/N-acyl-D-amino-acid deacylase [Frigoribacterium sp. PhB24]
MTTSVLAGGTVWDGSGGAGRVGDVVVRDGVVTAVGRGAASVVGVGAAGSVGDGRRASSSGAVGVEVVDATGLDVLPGFVDVHAHDDAALFRPGGVDPKTGQGVTTTIVGNCGHGVAPSPADPDDRSLEDYSLPVLGRFPGRRWATFAEYVRTLAEGDADGRFGLHAATLVPHAPLRAGVLGFERRPAEATECSRLAAAVGDALDAGALGVSLGLMYAPGDAADRPELVALARECAARGKLLVAHVRNEADALRHSIDELASLGRETGAAVHVSHLKVTGPRNVGGMPAIVEHLDALRDSGLDVSADVYPYDAGSTTVASLFPPATADRGVESLLEALRPGTRSRRQVLDGLLEPWAGSTLENQYAAIGPTQISLAGFARPEHAAFEGLPLSEIAASMGADPREALADLVLAERGTLTVIVFHTDLEGMRTALAWPHTLVGSDGLPRETGTVHPRLYGTFSRVLDVYAGSGPRAVLSRGEAIARMSTRASARFGSGGRGGAHADPTVGAGGSTRGSASGSGGVGRAGGALGIVPGAVADLQLVDPGAYADRADYATPRLGPSGLVGLWAAGRRLR